MQVFDIVLSQSDLTLIQSDIALSDSAATMTQISLTIAADTCKLQSQSQRDEPRTSGWTIRLLKNALAERDAL